MAAATAALQLADRYPDGSASALRAAIAKRYQLDPERIVCGAGSEELISLVLQAYCAPDDEVLFSQYGFIKYELAARAYGAQPVRAGEVAFTADVNALLEAVTPRTRVLFLATRTIRRALACPTAKCAACAPRCARTSSSWWMPPMRSSWIGPITPTAWRWLARRETR
jgi:hypothetical protein